MAENSLRFDFLARDRTSGTVDKISTKFDGLSHKLSKFGKASAIALGGLAVAAGGLATAGITMGIKTAAGLEQAQIGFTALLHSGKEAQSFLTDLKKFAAATPFELPGLIEASRTLIGVGLSTKQTKAALLAFGDAAGAVGIGQDAFQRIMLATSQSIAAGKIKLGDMNQLMNNGLPIWKLLSEAIHKPVPKIQEMISKGQLLTKDVLPKLEAQMEKDYGGAMAKQSQTLTGLWSTLMDTMNLGMASVIQPLIPLIKTGLTGAITFLGGVFKNLPGIIQGTFGALGRIKDYIATNVVPAIREAWGRISEHLPHFDWSKLLSGIGTAIGKIQKIDWSKVLDTAFDVAGKIKDFLAPIAKAIADSAKDWAGRIISGVQTGLKSGDWGPLGKTVADGIIAALAGASSAAVALGNAIGNLFSQVDWLSLGQKAAKAAIPFVVGFVENFFDELLQFAFHHPMDVLKFALAVIPLGKLALVFKPLRAAIEALPFGKSFISLLEHTAGPVWDAIVRFFKFVGGAIWDGFKAWFPTLERVSGGFKGIGEDIGIIKDWVWEKARDFIYGIGHAIGQAVGGVVRAIAGVISDMVRPFAKADGWLLEKGSKFIWGLIKGIGSMVRDIAVEAGRVISWLTAPFRDIATWLVKRGSSFIGGLIRGIGLKLKDTSDAIGSFISIHIIGPFKFTGRWLIEHGKGIIGGLLSGLRQKWEDVKTWILGIGSWIAEHKGPLSYDRRLLIPAGKAIMHGFLHGLQSGAGKAWSFVTSVGGKTKEALAMAMGWVPGAGWVGNLVGGMMSGGRFSPAVERWSGVVAQALRMNGLSSSLLFKVLSQLATESGGNPNAINLWDSNARAGTPSKGLMQVIGPTYLAYHVPGTRGNIYDPLSNIAAALNYAKHRYGSNLNGLGQGHGYDSGGVARGMGLIPKFTNAPERVLSPAQTKWFERAMSRASLSGTGGGGAAIEQHYYFPNYVGSSDDLMRALYKAAKRGQLDAIVRMAS